MERSAFRAALALTCAGLLALAPASVAAQPAAEAAAACGSGPLVGENVALIIGNGGYDGYNWTVLRNAANDAASICATLSAGGYSVRLVRNADFDDMQTAIERFAAETQGARRVVLYFAGHGFAYDGRNYLVPMDAPPMTRRSDIERRFVSLDTMIARAVPSTAVTLVMIDACRTTDPVVRLADPPATGEASIAPLGLVSIERGAILYSTAIGRPAYDYAPDEASLVSPFARAVAQHVATPGLPFTTFFDAVEEDVPVQTATMPQGIQQPYHYGRRLGGLYLIDPPAAGQLTAVPRLTAQGAAAAPGGHSSLPRSLVRGGAGPGPIPLTFAELSVEDEPRLIARVLRTHRPAEIAAMAASGDPLAQHLFGYMLHLGVGVQSDLAESRRWLERAVAQDYAPAQLELAWYLLRNQPDYPATVRAEQLMRAAVAAGLTKAKTHLAQRIASGVFGPADHASARRLYQEAADGGHVAAMFALTYFPDARASAIAALRAVAASGNREGNYFLCEIGFADAALATAVDDCAIAARANYPGAQALLARAYFDGSGVARDAALAQHWARLARADPELLEDGLRIADIPAE